MVFSRAIHQVLCDNYKSELVLLAEGLFSDRPKCMNWPRSLCPALL
jgi:hypothetical protein